MQFRSALARYCFDRYVLNVAIATLEHGGSVSNIDTFQLLPATDDWKFPKYPSRTAILQPDVDLPDELNSYIGANEALLREADCWLGTWIHPKTQQFYLDVTTSRITFEAARECALEFGQREGRPIVAIYNSGRNETVYL